MQQWFDALSPIYGDDEILLAHQQERLLALLSGFRKRYGPGPVTFVRAPGRVNLIGEHTDYNHGYVLPMALDKDVVIALRPRQDGRVRLANVEAGFAPREFEIGPEIPRLPFGDWGNYAQGPAQLLAQQSARPLVGFDALVDGSPGLGVPRGAGLSSSSALTVAASVALVTVNRLDLAGAALAEACGQAEWYVGTRGGVMDQFASLLSRQGHALFLDCRPGSDGAYHYEHVSLPQGYQVVVIDSQVHHTNTGPHFNRRVAEGRIGVRLLRERYPKITHLRDIQDVPWSSLEPLLPEVITDDELRARGIEPQTILDEGRSADTDTYSVRARCRHVHSENRRVLDTVNALQAGDVLKVGQMLLAAHESAARDYGISTPELNLLVEQAVAAGAAGARLTGAGWGGCVIALVAQEHTAELVARVSAAYRAQTGLHTDTFVCRSAQGAGVMFDTIA